MAKYLMLDRRLLNPQAMENIQLIVEPPVKDEINNPLFTEEKPWEAVSYTHLDVYKRQEGNRRQRESGYAECGSPQGHHGSH